MIVKRVVFLVKVKAREMISTSMFLVLSGMFLYCFWFIADRLFGTSYSTDIIFKYIPKMLHWSIIFIAAIPYAIFVVSYRRYKSGYRFNYRSYHFHFSFKKPARKIAQKRAPYKPARKARHGHSWAYRYFARRALRGIPMNVAWSWKKIINSGK